MTRRQTVLLGAAFVIAALGIVVARLLIDSAAALRAADAAAAEGGSREAIRRYLEAAQLYVPGSPFVRAAVERLDGIAVSAEQAGDVETARRALAALRAASLGTRSFFTPSGERLAGVDRRLARLDAEAEARFRGKPVGPERVAFYAERLGRRPGPSLALSLLALAGFGVWLAAAAAFIARGLDGKLRLRARPALACGAVFAVGFTVFLVALRLA